MAGYLRVVDSTGQARNGLLEGSGEPRQLIDSWSEVIGGPVLDAGCGPGHWTDYLTGRGLDAHGIDLVPAFIDHARSNYPHSRFEVGSIDHIEQPDASYGGILSWYSTIHHHPSRIAVPIAEFSRVLRPRGMLVLGFFEGNSIEMFDHADHEPDGDHSHLPAHRPAGQRPH